MGNLNNITGQIAAVWQGSTPAARVGLILLAVLCASLVGGVGYWSTQPYYVELAADLEPDVMKELVASLDRANIGYEIRGAGSALAVDKRNWAKAQMLARDSGVESGTPGMETLSPLDNPLNQHAIQRRNLERSLAASIGRFKGVEAATVHLSLPDRHPFLRQRDEPAASVVLTIRKDQRFAPTQAAAIASLVTGAVEGMRLQRVTITDTEGNQYSAPDESVAVLTRQDEFRAQREQELAGRAQAMLARYLGHENVVVRVAADFTFHDGETTVTTYDPEAKVLTEETIKSEVETADRGSGGAAGAAANASSQSPANLSPAVTNKTETTTAKYNTSRTEATQHNRTPELNLLTVSVVANSLTLEDKAGAMPPKIREKIEAVVKQAVGFRDQRDLITVEFFPFADLSDESETPAGGIPWEQINEALRMVSLAVAALVALVVAFLVLKRLRPAPAGGAPAGAAGAGGRLDELGRLVEQNPEVFSRIISAWTASPATRVVGGETETGSRRAA